MNDSKQVNAAPKIERTAEWNSQDILFSIACLSDTSTLFVGSSDFRVYEFDVAQEKPERVEFTGEGHRSYVTGMTRVSDSLVTGSYDGSLIWWDIVNRSSIRTQTAHDRWIRQVISSPDESRVISVADDMTCKIWDAVSGEPLATLNGHAEQTPHHYPSMLYAVAISNDGKLIATGDRTGQVVIWDADSFEKIIELEAPQMYTWDPKARRHSIGGIRSLAFSPDSNLLAVGGIGKIGNIDHLGGPSRLELFQWETEDEPIIIEDSNKKGLIEKLIWVNDGQALLGLGGDHKGFVNYYDPNAGELLTQSESSGHIHDAVINESESIIYTAGHNRISQFSIHKEDQQGQEDQ